MPVPLLTLRQEFLPVLADDTTPLYAVVVGPNYGLHRISQEDEDTQLGEYDRDSLEQSFLWPGKAAGGVVKLEEALVKNLGTYLRYYKGFEDANLLTDGGSSIRSGINFATNANSDRDTAAFGTRDVKIGDRVRLDWFDSVDLVVRQFETEVAGLLADALDGTLNPDLVRAVGVGDKVQGATESVTEIPPARFTTAYDVTAYDGLVDGYPEDIYTIRVLAAAFAGTGGLDGTRLRISSAGGDPVQEVELGTANYVGPHYEVALGSRGALLQITDVGAGVVNIGDYWKVTVAQNYTEVDEANALEIDVVGPYNGPKNTQYIFTVARGGEVGVDDLVFNVQTTNGADPTATLDVPASDFAVDTEVDYALGTRNLVITLVKNTQYRTGDQIRLDVEAPGVGPVRTLILRDAVDALTSEDLSLSLFAQEDVDFPTDKLSLTAADITVEGTASAESDLLGVVKPYPMFQGILAAEYRELLTADANELKSVDTEARRAAALGPAENVNPLGKAVSYALIGTAGEVAVYYMALGSDDLDGYTDAFQALEEEEIVYSLVPLSEDQDILDAAHVHITQESASSRLQWRIGWFPSLAPEIKPIYTQTGAGDDLLATVSEYSPGQYRLVNLIGGQFITQGVKPGDELRINIVDENTYDTFVIDSVESEQDLVLLTSLPAAITVPVEIEVHRNLDNDEFIEELGIEAAHYKDRRIYVMYADNPVDGDGVYDPFIYHAAKAAGIRSSVAPHQPMSRLTMPDMQLSPVRRFSRTQVNDIVDNGIWLFQRVRDGSVEVAKQVSTDTTDLNHIEQSITTNVDDISRVIKNQLDDLFGRGNVSVEMLNLIRQRIHAATSILSSRSYSAQIGPQLQGMAIVRLAADPDLQDTVDLELEPVIPKPLNNLRVVMKIA